MAREKFRNTYSTSSPRLSGWDYSWPGVYFITICTADRECIFGHIENKQMFLSEIGQIVWKEWEKSFNIRQELFCDNFVIMPNHIHTILRIEDTGQNNKPEQNKNSGIAYRPAKSVSSFAGGFKSASTTRINQFRKTPYAKVWQAGFYDHIIRNQNEYERIFNYITNNPEKWENDRFYHGE